MYVCATQAKNAQFSLLFIHSWWEKIHPFPKRISAEIKHKQKSTQLAMYFYLHKSFTLHSQESYKQIEVVRERERVVYHYISVH